ncbi:MAG TPA: M48 family metallopeptidase [Solirubrobacteraceae bacterium]|nr:M48 family metallopeptidase [Solirubrobacteraceae bacterium]
MSLPVEGYQLKRISAKAFEHPADRAATAALQSIPYLDKVIRKLIELGYERAIRQYFLGSSVRLGGEQLSDVYHAHARAYATLDLEPVPDLYLTNAPLIIDNAAAIGAKRPIVLVHAGLVRLLDSEHQRALFAHEAGHILSDHVLYGTALQILIRLSSLPGVPLPLGALRSALLEWYRAAELSCDRAAALVTRDPVTVCRLLMVIAAGAEAERLDLDAFMAQGSEYNEGGSGLERLTRLLMNLNLTHPMPVKRIHELMKWVKSGEYDRIVAGSYVSRDEPVRPRAEMSDAVAHYTERFKSTLRDAGESVGDLGKQLADWLRALDEDGGGEEDSER